jgi:hypothetical protein
MRRLFILSLAVLFILPLSATGQSLSNSERRHINSKILELVDDYERYASLFDDESAYYFRSLFVNENSMVHNDMIASETYRTQISVEDYVNLLRTNSVNTLISIKDLKKGKMTFSNGEWEIPVMFRKSFSYMDGNGYLFSVEEWHKTDFDMVMHVVYNEEQDVCRIQSITGSLDSDKEFPKGRFFIVNDSKNMTGRYNEYFSTLKVSGRPVEFNEFGQAIVTSGDTYVDDIDVDVDTVLINRGFNYDVVSYKFNPRNGRIKLRYGYTPNAYKVTGADMFDIKSPAMEFGFDFGFAFRAGSGTKMSFYTGLGAVMSSLNMSLNSSCNYSYVTSLFNQETSLWDKVERTYNIQHAEESVSYIDFMVPAYFEFEHRLGRNLMFSWNLGAKAYFNNFDFLDFQVKPGVSSVEGTREVAGNRESFSATEEFDTKYYTKRTFDCSVFGNMGFDVNMAKRKMYFMVRFGYEYGLMSTFKSNASSYYQQGSSYPVIYDSSSNRNLMVHPMINGLEINRMGMWISGGFKFKL